MKKILLAALLFCGFLQAQESDTLSMLSRRNEIRTDLISTIADSRFNLSYERFLDKDWSVGLSLGYANSDKINEDFDRGYRNYRPEYDITPFVRYNLSKSLKSFYFAEAFISANGGDFKETVRRTDGTSAYYENEKSTYSDFAAGGGFGYKLYIREQFGIEILVAFGANLFNTDKSPDVISRVGLSAGYRF